jgi:hypothetical protein
MKLLRTVLMLILIASPLLHVRGALAQVPPHPPGSICFTHQFWCWASPPGKAGTPCSCPTPYGWVRGQLG